MKKHLLKIASFFKCVTLKHESGKIAGIEKSYW